ncbi:pyruvate dehydrogenase E1 component [Klebsiella pneumoniae]|uniref:Pyruvate dehydrogenase E1 component n=1 Tax=Klebsiella pneumoniae TaxID=573 RepID=A0A377XMG0_KLEPN|nr:pyruvate dehydrogenase E1 component [Klebsiella pneumoniae]
MITAYWVPMASVVPTAVKTCVTTSKSDASYVVVAALGELAKRGEIDKKVVADAIAKFDIDAEKVNPRLA